MPSDPSKSKSKPSPKRKRQENANDQNSIPQSSSGSGTEVPAQPTQKSLSDNQRKRLEAGTNITTYGTPAEDPCVRCRIAQLQCIKKPASHVCGECRIWSRKSESTAEADIKFVFPPATSTYTIGEWDVLSIHTKKRIVRGDRINANGTIASRKCDRCHRLGNDCIFPTIHNRGRVCGYCTASGLTCINGVRAVEPASASDHPTKEPPHRRSPEGDNDDDPSWGYGQGGNVQGNETYQPQQVTA